MPFDRDRRHRRSIRLMRAVRQYILDNPLKWALDRDNPAQWAHRPPLETVDEYLKEAGTA